MVWLNVDPDYHAQHDRRRDRTTRIRRAGRGDAGALLLRFCPRCGYSMRGLGGPVCPECGERLDAEELRRAVMPWQTARWWALPLAFWATVWRVSRRPKLAVLAVASEVDARRAFFFRGALAVWLWLGLVGLVWVLFPDAHHWEDAFENGLAVSPRWGWALVGLIALGFFFSVLAMTGVHLYGFGSRKLSGIRQARSLALSGYAVAPLAWLPLVVMLFGAAQVLLQAPYFGQPACEVGMIAMLLAMIGGVFASSAWRTLYAIWLWLGRLADRSGFYRTGALLVLPLLWAGCWAVFGVLVPALLAYGVLMVWVLRMG